MNPTTGEFLKEYPYLSDAQLSEKIDTAVRAFQTWKTTSFVHRSELFHKLYTLMVSQKATLAQLDTLEMGMLAKDALGDVEKSASNAVWFADNAERLLAPRTVEVDGVRALVVYEPRGVVFSVMPWNYPYNQVLRSVIPNIMAGNVVLMKHASNVPQVAEVIEKLFLEAGFPEGVYTNLFVDHAAVEKIIAHPAVVGANVTGSEAAGKQIGSLSGAYFKPSVLELGGSDAFILGKVADLDKAVTQAIKGRFSNSGQKCNCSKRFIVVAEMYDAFVQKFTAAVAALKVGNPSDASTQIGPLAKESAVKDIEAQVNDSVAMGAKVLTGGRRGEGKGNFYLPTVLVDVKPGMRVWEEETFGPIAPVVQARDLDDAIRIANQSAYGLGCSIFVDDAVQAQRVALGVEAGNVSINKIVTSYAHLPYGGIKRSGYGKELAEHGLRAFVNEKVMVM